MLILYAMQTFSIACKEIGDDELCVRGQGCCGRGVIL